MASISLRNLSKQYPGSEKAAVDDFSLEIADKEFIVLVGPSGCGKSTTLRMLAGLEEITGGELFIGETLVNKTAAKDRDIAMVFQNYALYPHMTVFQNIGFGLRMRKVPKAEIAAKVNEAAEALGITDLLGRKPKALSGGERQRVALGRAMVRDPAVFLLDEPLSNLDAKLRASMRAELIQLHRALGATFVYVTHDQVEAMTMADRIVVMKDGVIQQVDSPRRLYDAPRNLFVAGFIGTPPMNFLRAVPAETGRGFSAELNGAVISFPQEAAPYAGRELILGIRPEALSEQPGPAGAPALDALVEFVERLGSETVLHTRCGGQAVVVRGAADSAASAGDRIRLTLDPSKVLVFDPETEEAIGLRLSPI